MFCSDGSRGFQASFQATGCRGGRKYDGTQWHGSRRRVSGVSLACADLAPAHTHLETILVRTVCFLPTRGIQRKDSSVCFLCRVVAPEADSDSDYEEPTMARGKGRARGGRGRGRARGRGGATGRGRAAQPADVGPDGTLFDVVRVGRASLTVSGHTGTRQSRKHITLIEPRKPSTTRVTPTVFFVFTGRGRRVDRIVQKRPRLSPAGFNSVLHTQLWLQRQNHSSHVRFTGTR